MCLQNSDKTQFYYTLIIGFTDNLGKQIDFEKRRILCAQTTNLSQEAVLNF